MSNISLGAAIAIAKKINGGGGGGGGGDTKKATVTLHCSPDLSDTEYITIHGAILDISSEIDYPSPLIAVTMADVAVADGDVYETLLYDGKTYAITYPLNPPTVSGDVTMVYNGGGGYLFTITGDCSITFEAE